MQVWKRHVDTAGFNVVDDDHYDKHDGDDHVDDFDARKFHGNAAVLDLVDDCDNEEFNVMMFHGVSKDYERVFD